MIVVKLLFLVLLIPQNLYSRYIDERDLTEYIKKIHQLIGAKQTLEKQDSSATVALGSVLALAGAGIAASAPHVYFYDHYYFPQYYYGDQFEVGTALLATGGALAALSAAKASALEDQAGQMEDQVFNIIKNLVYTDLDFLKDQEALTLRLSNQEIIQIEKINKELGSELQEIIIRSNFIEQNYQDKINTLEKNFQAIQEKLSEQKDSAYLKLLDPQIVRKEKLLLKKQIKSIVRLLQKYDKENKKQIELLTKPVLKQRKIFRKEMKRQQPKILKKQRQALQEIANNKEKQLKDLFFKYYELYYSKIL